MGFLKNVWQSGTDFLKAGSHSMTSILGMDKPLFGGGYDTKWGKKLGGFINDSAGTRRTIAAVLGTGAIMGGLGGGGNPSLKTGEGGLDGSINDGSFSGGNSGGIRNLLKGGNLGGNFNPFSLALGAVGTGMNVWGTKETIEMANRNIREAKKIETPSLSVDKIGANLIQSQYIEPETVDINTAATKAALDAENTQGAAQAELTSRMLGQNNTTAIQAEKINQARKNIATVTEMEGQEDITNAQLKTRAKEQNMASRERADTFNASSKQQANLVNVSNQLQVDSANAELEFAYQKYVDDIISRNEQAKLDATMNMGNSLVNFGQRGWGVVKDRVGNIFS